MNDFDKRFRETEKQIDAHMQQARLWAWVGAVVNLGIILFIMWVIVMVMRYFGIV